MGFNFYYQSYSDQPLIIKLFLLKTSCSSLLVKARFWHGCVTRNNQHFHWSTLLWNDKILYYLYTLWCFIVFAPHNNIERKHHSFKYILKSWWFASWTKLAHMNIYHVTCFMHTRINLIHLTQVNVMLVSYSFNIRKT